MGTIGLLAETLERTVENQELCRSGVEFTTLRLKIQEIEVPDEGFHLALRRPLTLRVLKELEYWLVNDNKTLVWGTGANVREAMLDYMWKWMDKVRFLEEHEANLGPGFVKELDKLRRLAV